ncbi:hypothetical protein ACN28S_42270 [Cystobacter fuscus]
MLKHMYWPVPGDACGALPVWDAPTPPKPSSYMGYETWPRAVAVATSGCKAAPGTKTQVSFLHGVLDEHGRPLPTKTFEDAKVVPLSDFYHQTFDDQALAALSGNDRAILNASAFWAYGRAFQAGDSIVSIAMHILTKEMPTWTMQSFWWHDAPDWGPYSSDRPEIPSTQTPDTWRHYLMASEYGIPEAGDPTRLPVRFNPYIELVSHPVATNCRNCHIRAAWPRKSMNIQPSAAYRSRPSRTTLDWSPTSSPTIPSSGDCSSSISSGRSATAPLIPIRLFVARPCARAAPRPGPSRATTSGMPVSSSCSSPPGSGD